MSNSVQEVIAQVKKGQDSFLEETADNMDALVAGIWDELGLSMLTLDATEMSHRDMLVELSYESPGGVVFLTGLNREETEELMEFLTSKGDAAWRQRKAAVGLLTDY